MTPRALACQHELVNFQTLRAPVLEQTRAGIELVRRFAPRRADIRLGAGLHDEAAADAVILLFRQYLKRRIVCGETHAVGMPRQYLVHVEQKVERFVERDLVLAQ
jgi:hypothetical protein